jgi:hypothetical protein
MSATGFKKIGLATAIPRGRAINIPVGGYTGGGGEFGATISDEDRTFAVTREPVAHRVVFTVAHDIFDNWFELQLQGQEEDEASQQFDKAVQNELNRLKAKRELMLMSTFERAYGYSILVLGYEQAGDFDLSEPVANPTGLREIKAYAKTQIPKVDVVKDKEDVRYGLPEYYKIKRPGIAAYLKVHHSRVIHFATRRIYSANKDEWEGMSVLDPLWDDLVTLRNIRWGMGQTMYRYGSGFPDITFNQAELADIDTWIASGTFANLSARTYFAHNENQTLEFKGLAGRALDPMNYYVPIMENISCASGIPLAILRGVQAGALTGSEVNQQEYYGLVSDEQSGYESGIRHLIDAVLTVGLPEKQIQDYEFNWISGIELPEERKTAIALTEAQTWQIKGQWMTRNEIRKAIDPDLPKLSSEQGGDEILGKASMQPFDKGEQFHVKPLADGSSTVTRVKRSRRR